MEHKEQRERKAQGPREQGAKEREKAAIPQEGQPDIAQLLSELAALRQREQEWVFREDLNKLRKAFPEAALESIFQLGDDFLRMRSLGIDPLTAFLAIRQAEQARQPQRPPAMGPAEGRSQGEEAFFAPEEVRRMTPRQVAENLKTIEKSQRRW